MWGGALSKALREVNHTIQYTGMDLDSNAIELGKKIYPDIMLKTGSFPESMMPNEKYDISIMFALFSHLQNWKDNLLALRKCTNKYINIGITLRLEGATIVDEDVSFFYYLDSGGRIPFVVHNIYELVNFCCIEKMHAKCIKIYGYHLQTPSTLFYPLPQSEVIKANLLIELLPENFTVKRIGGVMPDELDIQSSFRPEIYILIDGKRFDTISGKLG